MEENNNKGFFKTTPGIIIIALIAIGVGFFAGMEYKAYQIRSAMNEVEKKVGEIFSGESEKKNNLEKKEKEVVINKNIGDEVELATLKIKIKSFEEKNILSGGSTPAVAKEGAKFVILDTEITNLTDASMDYDSNGIEIVDDKGRRFSDYADVFFAISNYLEQRTIQPGIVEKGYLVYEIAKDAEHYSLNVGKAGTNEEYKIILK